MFKAQCLFVCLFYFCIESNARTAPTLRVCAVDDKECVASNAQAILQLVAAGISEIGINGVDPLFIPSVRADDPNLKMGFRNLNIYSLGKTKVLNIERDSVSQILTLDMDAPFLVTGQYDLKAKLSFIELNGDGDLELRANKTNISVMLKYEEIEKEGIKYYNIIGYDYIFHNAEDISIRLENLFGGDETKAKPFIEMIKNSAKEGIKTFGLPIFKIVLDKYVNEIKKFFLTVPANKLERLLQYSYYVV